MKNHKYVAPYIIAAKDIRNDAETEYLKAKKSNEYLKYGFDFFWDYNSLFSIENKYLNRLLGLNSVNKFGKKMCRY